MKEILRKIAPTLKEGLQIASVITSAFVITILGLIVMAKIVKCYGYEPTLFGWGLIMVVVIAIVVVFDFVSHLIWPEKM